MRLSYWMTSRRLGAFLLLVGFVWCITLMNMTLVNYGDSKSPEELRREILELSEKYVHKLAKETKHTVDGPYSGRLTGYDLKKTLAILLEDMMDRVENLEKRLSAAESNASHYNGARPEPAQRQLQSKQLNPAEAPVNAQDLIMGAQEDCSLTKEAAIIYPHCTGKISWMKAHWKSDPCYSEYGVDGSDCSFRGYLSEVERWCPLLPGRTLRTFPTAISDEEKAVLNINLDGLLAKLQDPGQRHNYEWIRVRITRLWPNWTKAAKDLSTKQDMTNRVKKRVLVHLGLLSKKSGFKIPEQSFKGGPLGELVQWSDIMSALYILGHDLTVTSEVEQLSAIIAKFPSAEAQCQSRDKLPIDMIYTDIVGLIQFKRKVKKGYGKFSCLLRIIDSFGTEPAFNFEPFAKANKMKTTWGMQNLNPQQFFTMFPHSPDNSFMGFVVEQHLNKSSHNEIQKKNQAVVYGKVEQMWQGKDSYLDIIRKYVDIHGTVFSEKSRSEILPSYVHNHGILSGPDLHRLLRESKLFIGLGFPYEGPAPLEAIAQGCVFINPKFIPPHNSQNTKFFKGKPTRRKVTSQHPYAEEFIGPPHVITVDIHDTAEVERVVQQAIKDVDDKKVSPYMPYEYTEGGMLQRVSAYIQHQDFCAPVPETWPPQEAITITTSDKGQSCMDACRKRKLICEPSYFKTLNSASSLEKYFGMKCGSVTHVPNIYYPAYHPGMGQCVLQEHLILFSCVGEFPDLARLCPCRTFLQGQIALCPNCL